jgi:hypothetical protein
MKVNNMPFLVTISRPIKSGTVAWLKNAKADTVLKQITDVLNINIKRVFLLEIVEVDGQFEPLRGALSEMGVTFNRCFREEHVPVAERQIHTLKEWCRCICNTLPFKKLPGMLVVQMVCTCNFWLNIFPPKDGISRNIKPRKLITGVKIDYNKHIQAEFCEHVQSMKSMTIPCRLRPLAQLQQNPLVTHKADIGFIAWPLVECSTIVNGLHYQCHIMPPKGSTSWPKQAKWE